MHTLGFIIEMAVIAAVIWMSIEHVQMREKINELLQQQYILKKDLKLMAEKLKNDK